MTSRSVVPFAVRLIAVLWVANMIQLGLRYSWGVALPQASGELDLSGVEAGTIASSFYVGYVAAGIPSGVLVDRLGGKRSITIGLLGLGAICFAIAASQSFAELLSAFLVGGILAGPIFPSSLKTVSATVGRGSRGTGVGALETVSPVAMIAAATVFPVVVRGFGWREVYVVLGAAALAVCAAHYFGAPEVAAGSGGRSASLRGVSELFANRELVWAVAVRLGGMWGIIGLSAWYYDFSYRLFGALNAQILYLTLSSAAVLGQVVGGVVSDRRGRKGVAAVGMLAFGAVTALSAALRTVVAAYTLAPLIGFAAFFWKSGLDTYILEVVSPEKRGSATGFMNTVSQVGSLLAPAAAGYALDLSGAPSPIPILTLALGPLAASIPMLLRTKAVGHREPHP